MTQTGRSTLSGTSPWTTATSGAAAAVAGWWQPPTVKSRPWPGFAILLVAADRGRVRESRL